MRKPWGGQANERVAGDIYVSFCRIIVYVCVAVSAVAYAHM